MSFFKKRWVKWRTLKGDAELAAARPADHAGAAERQGRLPRARSPRGPRSPASAEAGDRQPAAAGQLPQGRRAPRDLHVLVAGRAGVAGDRGPHVRGVRAGGTRSRRSTRSATPPRARSTAASPPSTPRRTPPSRPRPARSASTPPGSRRSRSSPPATAASAPPARSPTSSRRQDPYDGWSGNTEQQLDAAPHRGQRREELPGHRHPDLDRRRHPRRQRRVGRPGADHDAHRHGRLGADHRRGLPAPRRPQVVSWFTLRVIGLIRTRNVRWTS